VSAFRLIDAERASFSVPLMCRTLGVSRSGYYDRKETDHHRRGGARKTPLSPRGSVRSTRR
jgi:hypothetical protein